MVRRAFPKEFARRGYGLDSVATHFGINFQHHDALEEPRCAGEIAIRCVKSSDLTIEEWLVRALKPIGVNVHSRLDPLGDGVFTDEILVFTGSLELPRREVAEMAAQAGAQVHPGVTKHTTLLVVGNQDARKLGGKDLSSKHLKARELVAAGKPLRIISEADFRELVCL